MNTILYNWEEEANDEVKIGQGNTSSTSAAAIVARNTLGDNLDAAAAAANTDSLFDRKIDLITEGIDPFFVSKLDPVFIYLWPISKSGVECISSTIIPF